MSSTFIIDPTSISFEEAKSDIKGYIDSKPDALTWSDFFDGAAGQIIIELLAGLATFTANQIILGRREAYLPHAELRSSNIGISGTLGYSVFRGRNARIVLEITAPTTQSYSKWDVIGSVLDQDLIVLEDQIANGGVPTQIVCTLGSINSQILTADSDLLTTFKFTNPNVSDDVRLYLNATEVTDDLKTHLVELVNNKFVGISNAFGALDLYYLNAGTLQYNTGDQFTLEYIELSNIDFDAQDVMSNELGITNVFIDSVYQEPEPIAEIKVNAPLFYETQYVIRARDDFKKVFKALNSEITETNGRDVNPAEVELTYIRDDLEIFPQATMDALVDELATKRTFGIAPSYISHPRRGELGLVINVSLLQSTSENLSAIIDEILSGFEKSFEQEIDLELIEHFIEEKEYVKVARVSVAAPTWQANTDYRRVKFVTPSVINGNIYEFGRHVRKSGVSEPTWPVNPGDQIWDNEVLWEARKDYRCNFDVWNADTIYEVGKEIKPPSAAFDLIFTVVSTKNLTGATEPTFTSTLGGIIYDGEIIWQTVAITGSPAAWSATTDKQVGDIIVPLTSPTGFAYQCVGFSSQSGSSEPTWNTTPGSATEDGRVEWITKVSTTSKFKSKWNEYLIISSSKTINI